MSLEDQSLAWRRQVLEEATRLRSALKDAQRRRVVSQEEESSTSERSSNDSREMQLFEEAQAKLKRNTTRLEELRKRVQGEHMTMDAEQANLELLDMAQQEYERTENRKKELLSTEFADDGSADSEPKPTSPAAEPQVVEAPPARQQARPLVAIAGGKKEKDKESIVSFSDSEAKIEPRAATQAMDAEQQQTSPQPQTPPQPQTQPHQTAQVTIPQTPGSMKRAEDTWTRLAQENPLTVRTVETPTARTASESSTTSPEFAKPKVVKKEDVTFEVIAKEMHLTSSPLVFFNLACFQNNGEADLEVMLPICGYAVASKMLCVIGPSGTNTAILRVALSEPPKNPVEQREVHVADFTVQELIEVSDSIIRPDNLRPSESLIRHLGLETVAGIQIGTCIQRGAGDASGTLGTPRGSRNPEMPTPRDPTTPRFKGSGAGIQKAVLLMEDLVSVLDPESVFRVLRILRKIVVVKRATVIATLAKPFERRGLFSLFDDILFFTSDGVSYFGPTRRLKDYCQLIGSPCPPEIHVTDHLLTITNAAAKYDETLIKAAVDNVIVEFTGARPEPPSLEPVQEKPQKSGRLTFRRRKSRSMSKGDISEEVSPLTNRTRRLASRLAEERRLLAAQQKAEEKLAVWTKMSTLDSQAAKGSNPTVDIVNFEHMLLEKQQECRAHRPACFMNLACFLNPTVTEKAISSVIQPTCAFANEGQLLGVVGPESADTSNLKESLKLGSDSTLLTELTVRDTLKLSEFARSKDKTEQLNNSVSLLMGKMMLTACSEEVIGTLIQRGNTSASEDTYIEIGDHTFSTGVRSILLLDQIHDLDAQSLFIVLKLLKRVATTARLAVIMMLRTPEEVQGLCTLMDNLLIFNEEGVFFFGSSRHLVPYCALVGFPCPPTKHITKHVMDVMVANAPSQYIPNELNIETPFTVRYQYSALYKFNKGVIDISTKPQTEGGIASSRTFVPKSFRKKTSRLEELETILEKAELERQRQHRMIMRQEEEFDKQRQRDLAYEITWRKLADSDSRTVKEPLAAGLNSIASEMATNQKPSLFFNLACFLPNMVTDRIDMMQPICGYALVGRIVAIMGPPETDLSAFLRALSGADVSTSREGDEAPAPPTSRVDVLHRILTVFELLKLAESTRNDRGSQPIHETTKALLSNLGLEEVADVKIGTMIQRGLSPNEAGNAAAHATASIPSILMLDHISDELDPKASFVVLKLVKRIASQAQLAVIVHLPKAAERRGLYTLLDDALLFDGMGVAYFGPAYRLRDYLNLVGFPCMEDRHETDVCFDLLAKFAAEDETRPITDTHPSVRYKHSALAKHVQSVVEKFTRPAANEYDLQSVRNSGTDIKGTTFIPKNARGKKKVTKSMKEEERKRIEEEEAALRRARIAEKEAEAERQRIAEADAESVWSRLLAESTGETPS